MEQNRAVLSQNLSKGIPKCYLSCCFLLAQGIEKTKFEQPKKEDIGYGVSLSNDHVGSNRRQETAIFLVASRLDFLASDGNRFLFGARYRLANASAFPASHERAKVSSGSD